MNSRLLHVSLCLLLATASAVMGKTLVHDFPITTEEVVNELNLNGSTPSGTALVVFDTDTNLLEWFILYEGLTGNPTAMHFHGPAGVGETAGVDLGIGDFDAESSSGSATLTADQAADLQSGLWYLNIHTAANGAGEIRGQVVANPDVLIFDFPVTADETVNTVELDSSTPGGSAVATFDVEAGLLKWIIGYGGLTGTPTAMHFHGPASRGEATGVDLGIGDFGEASSIGSAELTAEQAARLKAGLWYLNIHTAANGSGEIRGQVVHQPEVWVFDFPIETEQVVNALSLNGSAPSGSALVTFDTHTNELWWLITYQGLTGAPTKMHFHGPAARGQATGVDLGIGEFDENSSRGSAILSEDQATDLRSGLWYLNIHTSANGAGEIRGQVVSDPSVVQFDFPVTAAQTVNDVDLADATPSGWALATYNPESMQLKWKINYSGLTGSPTKMHFHGPAVAGQPAGVDLGIGDFDESSSSGSAVLSNGQASDLNRGLWYLNIHTAANPPGEIRGQVEPRPRAMIFDFPISTDQVVNELNLNGAIPEGSALVTFDPETKRLEWNITYEGLTGAPTKMHFHGTAVAGQATGVDLGIGEFDDDSSTGSATLTSDQAANLQGGLWYLNIHTEANPAGEIRGQVVLEPGIFSASFPLGVDQVVNELNLDSATPCGDAVITYDADSNLLKWHIMYAGLTGAPTKMHFHGPALAGEAAGVDLGIGDFDEDGSFGSAILSHEQAADMRTGQWYLNVHTGDNPSGEIRGQVPSQAGVMVRAFPVTTAQTVNEVTGLTLSFGFGQDTQPHGHGHTTYNDRSNLLEWHIDYEGLSGNPTAMHFHGPAMPGQTASPDLGIGSFDDNSSAGSAIMTEDQEDSLTTGFWYLNIHTSANPAGEIRGQVVDRPEILVFTPILSVEQSVLQVNLDGESPSGMALVTLDTRSNLLDWFITYEDLTGAPSAIHFHGPALQGQIGRVDLGIDEFDEGSSVGSAFLTDDQAEDLEAGLWYLNVHTAANPLGEIRGQVDPDPNVLVFDFPINTDQVVNDLELGGAEPSGSGIVTLNPEDLLIKWHIVWDGLTGPASAMHFHGTAARGETAGVDFGIDDIESPSVGFATLSPENAENLQAGLWYLNIHTEANGAGEIRGQVLPASGGIWDGAIDLGEGWRFLEWFGFFNVSFQPWIYHLDLGFLHTLIRCFDSRDIR